jgi:curved DNA-binding protein CbpA
MNYYEELGLPKTASAEEVRRAYRSLARLLHPDQQSDETLRRLAGIQMARLNEILKTLTEPRLRVEYDNSLWRQASEAAAAGERMRAHRTAPGELYVPISEKRRWSRFAWPGAGVVGIGLIALFLSQDAAVQRPTGDGEGNVPVGEQLERGSGAWPVRTEGQVTIRNRKAEGREPDRTEPPAFSSYVELGKPLLPVNNNDKHVTGGGADSERKYRSQAGGFGGQWYYAKPAKSADAEGMCPPVYIDMEISESRGEVTGKYSARYMVGERPISPFVDFEFTGAALEPAVDLEWTGLGGAAGRVRLTLLSARTLRVEWSADKVGQGMGLASGMATLVRRGPP